MGFFSKVGSVYHSADKALTKAEKSALKFALKEGRLLGEDIVPKQDRRDIWHAINWADQMVGAAQTGEDPGPQTSAFKMVKQPYIEAKKHPSLANLYAAGVSSAALFPIGFRGKAGPMEWDAKVGGVIKNLGSEDAPRYRWFPPGSESAHPTARLDVNMMWPEESGISWLGRGAGVPGNLVHDFLDPLKNRFKVHGAKIDATPINTVVAGSILNGELRHPGMFTEHAKLEAAKLIRRRLRALRDVHDLEQSNPLAAGRRAQELRQALADDEQNPKELQGAFKAYERWMNRKQEPGSHGPQVGLAPYAARGGIYDSLMGRVNDPSNWVPSVAAEDVPRLVLSSLSGTLGEGIPAGRPRTSPEAVAANAHSRSEWGNLTHDQTQEAVARVRHGLPAIEAHYQSAREGASREFPSMWDAIPASTQNTMIRNWVADHHPHWAPSTREGGWYQPDNLSHTERRDEYRAGMSAWELAELYHDSYRGQWQGLTEAERSAAQARVIRGVPVQDSEYNTAVNGASTNYQRIAHLPWRSLPHERQDALVREWAAEHSPESLAPIRE